MVNCMTIDFDGIGGISPLGSTYADVCNKWGNLFRLSYLPEDILKSGRVIKAKTLVHFPAMKLRVVFGTDEPLQPDTPVKVVGAEPGCRVQTLHGLRVGMTRREALAIASRHYLVNVSNSGGEYYTSLDPISGSGPSQICLFYDDGLVDFIGVYEKWPDRRVKMLR